VRVPLRVTSAGFASDFNESAYVQADEGIAATARTAVPGQEQTLAKQVNQPSRELVLIQRLFLPTVADGPKMEIDGLAAGAAEKEIRKHLVTTSWRQARLFERFSIFGQPPTLVKEFVG
jgi:hypothetical protein